MAKVSISRVSDYRGKQAPVSWAVSTETAFGNNWEVEVNSLEDLARISTAVVDRLIVDFTAEGELSDITIYDDYME